MKENRSSFKLTYLQCLLIIDFIFRWSIYFAHSEFNSKIKWNITDGNYSNIITSDKFNNLIEFCSFIVISIGFYGLWNNKWFGLAAYSFSVFSYPVIISLYGVQVSHPLVQLLCTLECILSGILIAEWIRYKRLSAQQGDAPEPATNADPASPTSQPPAR